MTNQGQKLKGSNNLNKNRQLLKGGKREILPKGKHKYLPAAVWDVFGKFTQAGYEIYLVGGGVRNLLQNKKGKDCDFTTNADPAQIQALFEESFYDNKFGTVGIPVEKKRADCHREIYEITPYRTEGSYSDKRRPDKVAWGASLEEDLKRRDFTINAIVVGPALDKRKQWDGKTLELVDIFGGQEDLAKKIVRTVGRAAERFNEDALRLLRAVRFAASLGFEIEKKTLEAIKKNAVLIKAISAERIKQEILKILASDQPAEAYRLLQKTGLAGIIFPEVEKAFGVGQKSPKRHHVYDVGTHLLNALKFCPSKDPIVRLATLLHDTGKVETRKVEKNKVVTFYNHEIVSTTIAYNLAKRLRFSKKELKRLTTLVRWHQFSVDERQTDKALRRFIRKTGRENLEDMLALRTGDRLGGGARETSWRLESFKKRLEEVQKQPFAIKDLKIGGAEVMKVLGIGPGPRVGLILKELFEKVEEGELNNTKKALLAEVRKKLKSVLPEGVKNH